VIAVRRLGRLDYADALELQRGLVEARRAGSISDTLLLLEHPPVITFGARNRTSGGTNLIATPEELEAEGIALHESGRGGDVTYHGPGQLVGYPIVDLRPDRCDVHRYVRDLEEVLIRALATLDVKSHRLKGRSGVWVGAEGREEKVAAIGVRISRWITSHGFALNVDPQLRHFGMIVPCGIADRGVTSLAGILGRRVDENLVQSAVESAFLDVFADRRG
jgi:lipoyl(octanoyl) transferase